MGSRVVSFAGAPPTFFDSPEESWHTHAGLCFTSHYGEDGRIDRKGDQQTSFLECQALPSIAKTADSPLNPWINIWMLHLWQYDLNPDGKFANTHPCLDQNALPEHELNGDREVPPFFAHHG